MQQTVEVACADEHVGPGPSLIIDTRRRALAKRALDVVVASVAVFLLAPLVLLIALFIVLEDGRGALFVQWRIGRHGRRFPMLKFRTMRHHGGPAPARVAAPLSQSADDPRCTRVGRLLRRTYLDELPQIYNVLAGHMSLVGPRPLVPEEDALVTRAWPARHEALPGLTGTWQLERTHGAISVEQLIRLDQSYVAGWSLRADLKLLARTVAAVARRTGR
jgi:lipopolysaccharide/colanic/teichoic acid biosynthesis glycosyltransferase